MTRVLTDLVQGARALKSFDARRRGVPGEHWAAAAAARRARHVRSPAVRKLLWLVGGVLLLRALSGRDGPLSRLKRP